jgi:tripartite-type tricarboxylate transporter receptor subunit TctC
MRNTTILLSALLILPTGSPAAAQSVAEFYKGKQIEYIIAAETGSIYDTWGRMLSRYMPTYVPGNPAFVAKNMPGAGHIRAAG